MNFPVHINLFGLSIDAHLVFEMAAYSAGFQIYLRTRKRWQHPPLPTTDMMVLVAACIVGALVGSKLLNIAETPLVYWANRANILFWLSGKTIVGGFIGGWLGVEIAKKQLGIAYATGDAYVFPLIAGTAIGRVGCFLAGLEDGTYGVATGLPWGVDFGDGIIRHPTQLYEIAFVLLLGVVLYFRMRRPYPNGYLFRAFMLGYFAFRFAVEFLKPRYDAYLGLSAIQIASLAAAAFCAWSVTRLGNSTPSSNPQGING